MFVIPSAKKTLLFPQIETLWLRRKRFKKTQQTVKGSKTKQRQRDKEADIFKYSNKLIAAGFFF